MDALVGIIPASGKGTRFGGAYPKQFMSLAGRPLIDHAIAALLADARVREVHVVCASTGELPVIPGASLSPQLQAKVQLQRCGQATRAGTVAAAARLLVARGAMWLAVHDAVRPCLHAADLQAVLDAALTTGMPALLAEPLRVTLKQCTSTTVTTLSRTGKWLAQTPQVARADELVRALTEYPDVTDEAQALELSGAKPLLVEGMHANPKVTTRADFAYAVHLLNS